MGDEEQFKLLKELMHAFGIEFGQMLADYSEYGSLLACGRESSCGTRRWSLVLATNDAAVHLDQWADEQKAMRVAAAEKMGIETLKLDGFN